MALTGLSIIGQGVGRPDGHSFAVRDRLNGDPIEPTFYEAAKTELDEAVELAAEAFRELASIPALDRAAFLDAITQKLEERRDEIVTRAYHETGLPVIRLNGELTRTCGQLQFFATMVRRGTHLDIRIDLAEPLAEPTPKPEIRSMLRPLGPVAVFGASNFPLAFSVAGGDTASALAAGCPVVVKAHPSHPGTSELAGQAIRDAAEECGMPEGIFSMLHLSHDAAGELIDHAEIAAAGFTGSRSAGMALSLRASNRSKPIPFFAEMSSLNPVVAFPKVLAERGAAFAKGLAASVTQGVGQFCTNPGLVFAVGESEAFLTELRSCLEHSAPGLMLTDAIADAYLTGAKQMAAQTGVTVLLRPSAPGVAGFFVTDLATFVANRNLHCEVFGPSTLVVKCKDIQDAISGLKSLEGQLTVSLHLDDSEIETAGHVFAQMERIAGRLLVNAFPTGVQVCEAMVHGGPFPATSDGRSTSVGGRAILRWMRAVCYQDVPEELLPPELRPPPYS